MNRQELAIARSVVYSSLFDYPLTIDQLHRSLVECEMTPAQIASVYARSAALAATVRPLRPSTWPSPTRGPNA